MKIIVLGTVATLLFVYSLISYLFRLNKANQFAINVRAVFVLGGGLTANGNITAHTQLRIDRAVKLYKNAKEDYWGKTFIITSGRTAHKPNPVDADGFPIWEATAAAKRLIEMGVPAESVMEEAYGLDTLGSAYFLRALHMDPSPIRNLVVITNKFHMDRAKAIFDKVFGLNQFYGWWTHTDHPKFKCHEYGYSMSYDAVADGLEGEVLAKRIEREKSSLKTFLTSTKDEFHSMEELHKWLYTNHAAYASSRLIKGSVSAVVVEGAIITPHLVK